MTVFSKIVNGAIPCYKVAETEKFFAFLDINPLTEGHTLIIPKHEVDYLFDLPTEEVGQIMQFAQQVADAQKRVINCTRIGVAVIGLEVPHAHIHLIPITTEKDMNFANTKLSLSPERMAVIAKEIAEAM